LAAMDEYITLGDFACSSQWRSVRQACFTQPGDTSFGNEPRVDAGLRAQGIDTWDFSIVKTTKIHESVNLEFRTELFNIFNAKNERTIFTANRVVGLNSKEPVCCVARQQ
jgi:hypothetical protein